MSKSFLSGMSSLEACYRQIVAEKIKNKTSDITRTTVQKSVCVLSRLPLYSQIQVKLSLIPKPVEELHPSMLQHPWWTRRMSQQRTLGSTMLYNS